MFFASIVESHSYILCTDYDPNTGGCTGRPRHYEIYKMIQGGYQYKPGPNGPCQRFDAPNYTPDSPMASASAGEILTIMVLTQ